MNINLDIQTLRSFIKVGELGNFTRAAEALRLTQPAISQQIKRLEELLDVELFRRDGRVVQMTAEGEKMMRYARQIVETNDNAGEMFRRNSRKSVVNLGMPEHFSEIILPRMIGELHDSFPDVQLVIKVARSAAISELIEEGRVDLGIVIGGEKRRPEDEARDIDVRWFAGQKAKLAREHEIPLVLFRAPCSFRNMAIKLLEQNGYRWRCAYESEDLISVRSAVIAGVGVTALPYLTDIEGLVEMTGPVILPALPQVGAALTQRAGWNPPFKRSISSKILGIWTDFQNERGAQALSRLDIGGSPDARRTNPPGRDYKIAEDRASRAPRSSALMQ